MAAATPTRSTTNITYDTRGPHLPHTITTPGLTTNFTYDSTGNLLTQTLTDTTSTDHSLLAPTARPGPWTYTYNGTGQLLTAQIAPHRCDRENHLRLYRRHADQHHRRAFPCDDDQHVRGGGCRLTITDPNSVLTTLSMTPRNWLSSSVLTTSAAT